MEQERDFYFSKLRDIEDECRRMQSAPELTTDGNAKAAVGRFISKIKSILYEGPDGQGSQEKLRQASTTNIPQSPLKEVLDDHPAENENEIGTSILILLCISHVLSDIELIKLYNCSFDRGSCEGFTESRR